MTALQETSSEDLGFKLSTKPEGIRIFNDTIDFSEGDKNDLNLLSIGNLTGYFACSNMTSIVLDRLSLFETGEIPEGRKLKRIENLTNISQLTFNSDESKLYVVVDGNLSFIDMRQFEASEPGPEILQEIKNIEDKYIQGIKVIHPSPVSPDVVGLINNSGELIVIDSGVARSLHSDVSTFCWAKNGKTIYYGTTSSVDVSAVSINGDFQFKIENSAVSDPEEVNLISIIELESNLKWFTVYDRGEGEPEDHEYQIYIIQKVDDQTYEFSETDIAPPFGSVARFGTYYLSSLSNWSPGQTLVFVTSSLATEISTLFINAEGNIESITQLNDSDRAQFPINDDTGDDASPIGLGLELSCLEYVIPEPCSGIDEAKGTLPRLWCLTHEGSLISWWIFDIHGLKDAKVSLQRALDSLKKGVVIGSKKPVNEHEVKNDTKVSNSNSPGNTGENQEQSIKQPSSDLVTDKDSSGSSVFDKSKLGSTSSATGFGSTGFGSTGFGSNSSSTGTSAGSGFGSTGFGASGFGESKKSSETAFGSSGFGSSGFGSSGFGSSGFGSSGFGSSTFGTTSFGSNNSESKNDNKFGNTGFGKNTTTSNGSYAVGGFGKYSNTNSQNQSSPFSNLGNKESPFAKFGKESQSTTENKVESPFSNLGNKESPFAKFGKESQSTTENKAESPFANFGKESQSTTENKVESPFSNLGNKESPFAKFGKESQSTTENKVESPFAKFGKEVPTAAENEPKSESPFSNLVNKESPFAKFGKESQSTTENKAESPFANFGKESQSTTENKVESLFSNLGNKESPFAKFGKEVPPATESKEESSFSNVGKETDATFEITQSPDSSNQSATSNEETSSETPFEEEVKNETDELIVKKDKVPSHTGTNKETQGSLFRGLRENAEKSDKQSDSETSSPESSESSDETDGNITSKPRDNVASLLGSMDIKSSDKPSKSEHLDKSGVTLGNTKNSNITSSHSAKTQEKIDLKYESLTPPSPLEFLIYDGLSGPVKSESNSVSKKIIDIYNETCGYLIIMKHNVKLLSKFIDDHNITIDTSNDKISLETPELWRLSYTANLAPIINQVKPTLSSILKSSNDLDSSLTKLTAKVEEGQVQRIKIDKLLSQLSFFSNESNSLALAKRPLDFQNEALQTSLRQKLRKVKDLENELKSKMMPFKARSRADENILKNLEKVIFQINESAYDHLKEINSLSVKLCDLKLHNESESEIPKHNSKPQRNLAPAKWALSKELKNNYNSSPRLVSLERK